MSTFDSFSDQGHQFAVENLYVPSTQTPVMNENFGQEMLNFDRMQGGLQGYSAVRGSLYESYQKISNLVYKATLNEAKRTEKSFEAKIKRDAKKFEQYFKDIESAGWVSPELSKKAWETWSEFQNIIDFRIPVPDASPGEDSFLFSWNVGHHRLRLECYVDGNADIFYMNTKTNLMESVSCQNNSLQNPEVFEFLKKYVRFFQVG